MKIILYKAKTHFPESFNDLSYWIEGKSNQIFFSNRREFDESQVEALLPVNIKNAKDQLFLVPHEWKKDFYELIKDYGDWQKRQDISKISKEQVGFNRNTQNEFSQFYEESVEIVEIWVLEDNGDGNGDGDGNGCGRDLETLFNEIVEQKDGIDAIFIYRFGDNSGIICSSTTNKGKNPELVKILSPSNSHLFDFNQLEPIVQKFGNIAKRGEFRYAIFKFTKGILDMCFAYRDKQLIAICFVSIQPKGLGGFIHFVKKETEKIKEKLHS